MILRSWPLRLLVYLYYFVMCMNLFNQICTVQKNSEDFTTSWKFSERKQYWDLLKHAWFQNLLFPKIIKVSSSNEVWTWTKSKEWCNVNITTWAQKHLRVSHILNCISAVIYKPLFYRGLVYTFVVHLSCYILVQKDLRSGDNLPLDESDSRSND